MRRAVLGNGAIAGLIVAVPLFLMMVATAGQPPIEHGAAIGYTIMLIALSTIFLAIKPQRDVQGGGVIRFWPAFLLGTGISAVAGLFYVIAWEAALAWTGADFIGAYSKHLLAREAAAGASAEKLAGLKGEMDAFARSYANPLFRMPLTFIELFPIGVLVSLVSAALLRKPGFMPARRDQRSDGTGTGAALQDPE
jgi:hypothetical protein